MPDAFLIPADAAALAGLAPNLGTPSRAAPPIAVSHCSQMPPSPRSIDRFLDPPLPCPSAVTSPLFTPAPSPPPRPVPLPPCPVFPPLELIFLMSIRPFSPPLPPLLHMFERCRLYRPTTSPPHTHTYTRRHAAPRLRPALALTSTSVPVCILWQHPCCAHACRHSHTQSLPAVPSSPDGQEARNAPSYPPPHAGDARPPHMQQRLRSL